MFLRQGHYAELDSLDAYAPADLALDQIEELVDALVGAQVVPDR